MKVKILILFAALCTMFSGCSNEDGIDAIPKSKVLSQAVNEENSDTLGVIILVKVDSSLLNKMQKQTRTTRSLSPMDDMDNYFSENIYQLRDLPLIIQARGTGNKQNKFFSCDGAGKEVVLAPISRNVQQWFYIRVLPASTGIPYMIYSYISKTPLTIGHYRRTPDIKILYAKADNQGSTSMCGWDLNPANYQGYFAITSCDYIGQSDPKNSWSIFYYSLEAQNENKIGYAQYTKKAQQEFLIQPKDDFTVEYIDFDKSTAKVNKRTPLEVVSYCKNETEERRPFTATAAHYVTNASRFSEKSNLKIPFVPSEKFYCPKVEAEHLVVPSPMKPKDFEQKDFERNIYYSNSTQSMQVPLMVDINGTAKPNSLVEVTSWLENYNVSVDYTAYMTYEYKKGDVRTVKIKGTWYGTLYTTKRAKSDVVKCFDLDDGEELSHIKNNMFNISKAVLK